MVISAVLPAWGRPTWIRCPPMVIAPRLDTRRRTVSGAGSCGGPAVPARAPRSPRRAGCGTRQAMVRTTFGQDVHHGAVSLLDHAQLPQHERERRTSSEATVSHIKRSRARRAAGAWPHLILDGAASLDP